jgi:hypothetical protein
MPRKPASKTFQPIPYEVTISMASNDAYLIRVGCETHVFNSPQDILDALKEYLVNPKRCMEQRRKIRDARQALADEAHHAYHTRPRGELVEARGIPCQEGNTLRLNH